MKKLKNKYFAKEYALNVVEFLTKGLIVKVKGSANQYKDQRWYYFYNKNKLVGQCNPIFFRMHFVKVVE